MWIGYTWKIFLHLKETQKKLRAPDQWDSNPQPSEIRYRCSNHRATGDSCGDQHGWNVGADHDCITQPHSPTSTIYTTLNCIAQSHQGISTITLDCVVQLSKVLLPICPNVTVQRSQEPYRWPKLDRDSVMQSQSITTSHPRLPQHSAAAPWSEHPSRSRRAVGPSPIWGSDSFQIPPRCKNIFHAFLTLLAWVVELDNKTNFPFFFCRKPWQ